MIKTFLVVLALCSATSVAGATLTVGAPGIDTLPLVTLFPPALEVHPSDPDRAWIAIAINGPGAFEMNVDPNAALTYTPAQHLLSAGHDCSPDPVGAVFVGNLFLENVAPGVDRGWIASSSCEIVIPFDLATGALWDVTYETSARDEVPAYRVISDPNGFTQYTSTGPGSTVTNFATGFTADVLRVGSRLLVVSSNLAVSGASPVFNPGTVLLFDIVDDAPLRATTISPADPPYLLTSDPNPVALTALPNGLVAVTNAGVHDAAFPPAFIGQGSIDIIDAAAGGLVGSFPVGAGNPGGRTLAVDPNGSIAVAGSRTIRELYAFDLRGLAALPVAAIDPALQRASCNDVPGATADGLPCLRDRVVMDASNALTLPPPPATAGVHSFMPEIRFSASGDFVAATSFNDGGLALAAFDTRNLDRPHPLLPSRFGAPETLAATAPGGVLGAEANPGPMLLHANSAGGLAGAHVLYATGQPNGLLVRGVLGSTLAAPTGDFDSDGTEDALDVCPVTADALQDDADADGIGDACQCGDVDDDGVVALADVTELAEALAGIAPVAAPQKCDVSGDGACGIGDSVRIARQAAGRGGALQTCAPAIL